MALLLTLIPVVYIPALIAIYFLFAQPSKWKRLLPVYLFCIFVFAYCITPSYVNDLTRYMMQMERFAHSGLLEVFETQADALYVTNTIFWLFGKMQAYHFVPAIATTIVYGVSAYIICDYAEKHELSKYIPMAFVLEFCMLPFFSIVNNVRNVTAFGIGVYAAYYELEKGKRNFWTLFLYIVPIFIHKTGFLILLIRLVTPLFKRLKIFAFGIVFLLPISIEYAFNHIGVFSFGGTFGTIVRRFIISAHNYLLGESDYAAAVRASAGSAITRVVVFAFLLIMVWLIFKDSRKYFDRGFMTFTLLLCVFSFACNVFDTPAYWRFAIAAVCCCGPILLRFLSGQVVSKRDTQLITLMLLGLSGARFALSTYTLITRVDVALYLETTLTTNLYTLVWDFLVGVFRL